MNERTLWVFRDGDVDGPTNMARDEHLLYSDTFRPAALRIYGWTPATISLGCFQSYARVAELDGDARNLPVVRRATGGGAILHDREITYCLVVDDSVAIAHEPPTALYRLVHEVWRDVITADGVSAEMAPDHFPFPSPRSGPFFCFEKPGRTDLIIGDQKLLGSAQRRIPGRVLQHGSLLLGQRYAVHPGVDLGQPPADRVQNWIETFIQRIAAALEVTPQPGQWQPEQADDIDQRRAKYASDEWTRRR